MRALFVPLVPTVAAAALLLSACGGGDANQAKSDVAAVDTLAKPQDSSESTAALVKAVADYLDAQAAKRKDAKPDELADAVAGAIAASKGGDTAATSTDSFADAVEDGLAAAGNDSARGSGGNSAGRSEATDADQSEDASLGRAPVERNTRTTKSPANAATAGTTVRGVTSIDTPAQARENEKIAAAKRGATDIGVTKDSIKLGTVSMHGIALGNLIIDPMLNGLKATAAAINDRGGVLGRTLSLIDCDDGPGEVARSKACLKKLQAQDQVFSLIGYLSWASASVHSDLAEYKLPAVGTWAYSQTEWQDPYMFPTHMSMIHEAMANANWVANVIKPKTYGLICLTSPEMQLSCNQVQKILEPTGAELVNRMDVGIAEASMSPQVLAMRAANPEHIVHYVINPATMIKFMVEAAQQNYYPPKGISGNHLAAEVLGSLFGEHPAGRYWANTTYKLWGKEFLATMNKYARGNKGLNHHIVQSTYAGALFFEKAAKAVGPNLTRERLMAQLGNGDVYATEAGMDQKFSWSTAERGGTFEKQTWDPDRGQGREFMYLYASADTASNPDGSPNGWQPDPDQFVIHTHK